MEANPRVVVIGLGIAGSSIAASLAARGYRVTALDRFAGLHERGSSHGDTRIYRRIPHEGDPYVELAGISRRGWHRWSALAGEPLLVECGGVDAGPASSAIVAAAGRLCREHGATHELLSGAELNRRFPLYRLPQDWQAVYQPESGYLRPDAARSFLWRTARDAGARLLFGTAALRIECLPAGIQVHTAGDRIAGDLLIVAAGPWLPPLLPGLPLDLHIERRVTAWYRRRLPAATGQADFPVFCLDADGGWYGMPTPQGTVKIGHDKHLAERIDPDTLPVAPGAADAARLAPCAQRYFPGLDPVPETMKSCIYTITPDHHFLIDRLPREPRVLIFSCCSGHGFKYAPAYGEIAADLAAGRDRPELAALALSREARAATRFAD